MDEVAPVELRIRCDASKTCLGLEAWQEYEGKYHPIRFASRKTTSAEKKYCEDLGMTLDSNGRPTTGTDTRLIEAMAIVWAMDILSDLIQSMKRVLIENDHRALAALAKATCGKLYRWALKLRFGRRWSCELSFEMPKAAKFARWNRALSLLRPLGVCRSRMPISHPQLRVRQCCKAPRNRCQARLMPAWELTAGTLLSRRSRLAASCRRSSYGQQSGRICIHYVSAWSTPLKGASSSGSEQSLERGG